MGLVLHGVSALLRLRWAAGKSPLAGACRHFIFVASIRPTESVRVEACGRGARLVGELRGRLIKFVEFLFTIAEAEPCKNLTLRVSMQFESLCRQCNIAPKERE